LIFHIRKDLVFSWESHFREVLEAMTLEEAKVRVKKFDDNDFGF